VTADARQQLAERVVRDLEQSGFELDDEGQVLRKLPPTHPHCSLNHSPTCPTDGEQLTQLTLTQLMHRLLLRDRTNRSRRTAMAQMPMLA
jgi:hypothetical protein